MNLQIELSKPFLKTQVMIIRHFLKEGVCEKCHTSTSITQSTAYNLLAQMYGFEDWNVLAAMLKDRDKINLTLT